MLFCDFRVKVGNKTIGFFFFQQGKLDYVGTLSPSDKYGQHETSDYSQQQQSQQQQEHENEYGMHSPTSARQSLKEQTLVKSEPGSQQNYVQLPPFLN